jgi:hypothetical protein
LPGVQHFAVAQQEDCAISPTSSSKDRLAIPLPIASAHWPAVASADP